MQKKFIQLHALTSFSAALLNRDDAGLAKRLPYGGTLRTRVSSQCLKRHWRTHKGDYSLKEIEVPSSVRSRLTFEELIVKPLVEVGHEVELIREITKIVMNILLGESAKASKSDEDEILKTDQITILGKQEIEFLKKQIEIIYEYRPEPTKIVETVKKHFGAAGIENLKALKCGAGLDAALFGRMVTSDNLARVDAAIHVAHAFTVHAETSEMDYFAAIDDLQSEGDKKLGSGHINSAELTTGIYYLYALVDVPLLIANIEGCAPKDFLTADQTIAEKVVENLVHLMAKVSPGAKLGSTAPYSFAHFFMVEKGDEQPRKLDGAYFEGIKNNEMMLRNSLSRMAEYIGRLDKMYGTSVERSYSAIEPTEELVTVLGSPVAFDDLAVWAAYK